MRVTNWLMTLLLGAAMPALSANHGVAIGDSCEDPTARICFWPQSRSIAVGDTVNFIYWADSITTGPHNVVADDGSFRCARGCDGEGGDGNPVEYNQGFGFSRTFSKPGRVTFRDEASLTTGEIIVKALDIGKGFTGAWFDPAQSGHGLFLEVLPDNQLLAAWLTFSPSGEQAWFVGLGPYSGNTAILTSVDQPTGGRWIPNFDSSKIVHNPWGTLTITFTDCNNGRVDYDSRVGFGIGSMNLRRLTVPAGVGCP
jgi:plastocyanin